MFAKAFFRRLRQQDHPFCSRLGVLIVFLLFLPACASIIQEQTQSFAGHVEDTILNANDLQTVEQAIPAYLILLDSMIASNPDSSALLFASSELYGAYASVFVNDSQRQRLLTDKALAYALRGACVTSETLCQIKSDSFDKFSKEIDSVDGQQIAMLYTLGAAWSSWLQARASDWNAIAELPRIDYLMRRVEAIDDTYDHGNVHLYLGVLGSLIPAGVGGKPEVVKKHFQRAIEISNGKNLMAKLLMAKHYARQRFDQSLHDKLLREVLSAKASSPRLTLSNVVAKKQAIQLLEESADYFE